MGEYTVIIIVLILFAILLIFGQYISSLLITVGLIGVFLLEGPSLVSGFLLTDPFTRVASYTLSTVPLFVLMAQFVLKAGIVKDLYHIMYKVSRNSSGLLGVLTIVLGGLLGAVSGSGTASSAALGQVAEPELAKRGYGKDLAGSVAAAGGSLSAIIPPSIIIIIYGAITQTSIGDLFIAAVIPSILMVAIYSVYTLMNLNISKKKQKKSIKDQSKYYGEIEDTQGIFRYIVAFSTGLLIVFTIFGGIYFGIFTPTEAAGVGALVSFIAALCLRVVNIEFIKASIKDTVNVTTMTMLIMIGAQLFGRFLSVSLLPRKVIELLGPLVDYPFIIMMIIFVIFFFLFMFIEGSAVIVMTVPIVLPLVTLVGFNEIWFGIILCVICSSGLLTPPVGLSVYAVSGVTGTPINSLFRHTTIYAVLVLFIVGGLLTIFPQLVTWLPANI
ncbi:TRAP transporter large permease [Lentibacillus amyloliquefaciens]|uniref:Neu5Ac permease n=1 Tax=Lentibacillus amyloliquefaciens TaxID=1472767 RepID=A0A0U4FAR2_9BACI|nr:TRAP transporter large permease subunit [Lentibacillus amyloliquefaciens]ALX47581.1 Neu5Ac permease [Lentibacillus amyloliquefaciens]